VADAIFKRELTGVEQAVPVAFVSSHGTRGGAERYLSLLLSHLPRAWINNVVALKHGGFVDDLREQGLPVEVIDTGAGPLDIIRGARRLRSSLAASRPAVVHANGLKAALVAELATTGTRMPVMWFKHDVSRDGWLGRLVGRRAAWVIGPSNAVIEPLGATSRNHAEVVPYQLPDPQVDEAAARAAVLAEFPDGAENVVALVARLDPFKGQDDLIAAAPTVLARAPGTRFLLVGGEDPAHVGRTAELRRQVAERGLGSEVRLTGFRSDALELICGSDVLAIPSIAKGGFGKEGFPYVGLEALALGTPVVYYAHGGLPEQIGDCGVLVPPGDRSALADAIVALVQDRERRTALAACGRARFEERFRWSSLAEDIAERYQRIAAL
jgi:glycosyltransferase involved in cell wall biosynthesis